MDKTPNPQRPSRQVGDEEITQAITSGIVFRGARKRGPAPEKCVRTKAKKKGYITGSHGSASARKKADIRTARANRHKK